MMSDSAAVTGLKRTALHDLHVEQGAKMVEFAGDSMPVQYPLGVKKEHEHTRAKAGLFDVSHMGELILRGENVQAALETLVPTDIVDLPVGMQRYGLFTSDTGGILDDLMIVNGGDHLCGGECCLQGSGRRASACGAADGDRA